MRKGILGFGMIGWIGRMNGRILYLRKVKKLE